MAGDFPDDLRYTESDEWVRQEGGEAVTGITAFAAEQLGDVVYVQLPSAGTRFSKGDSFGEIESVKAVSDLYCPISGEVAAVNEELDQNPALVNEDPYGKGWMVRLRVEDAGEIDSLLDARTYEQSTLERA
jgi:glycine cleavage system H protein